MTTQAPVSRVRAKDAVNAAVLKYDFDRHELLPFIPDTARSLLDVGCGSGAFGRLLRSARPGMELWAVEPDPASARAAQDGFDRVVPGTFPDRRIPPGKFDVVLCADVLEHMAEPEMALRAAAQATAAGGMMVASIPNVRNWRHVLWPLFRHGKWEYTERGILDRTHLRFFTRSSMRDLFTDNDWLVESVTGINLHGRERILSAVSGRTLDDFLYPQYVVVAHPCPAVGPV
jgi:2-polyprenyl-3-methyl-5-hydroxy-6-metoxy-1,4-benzoquinol methylase